MNNRTTTLVLALLLSGSSQLLACSDDDAPTNMDGSGGDVKTGGTAATGGSTNTGGMMQTGGTTESGGMMQTGGDDVADPTPLGEDSPPEVGAQIDRIGRPAISAATVGTFTLTDDDARNKLKDDYNADDDAAGWVEAYTETIAQNLAVLDGLDRNCGNQLAYNFAQDDTGYTFLASVLANDRLWVNAASTTCDGTYLGVELEALGAIEDGGCGGRALSADVIDISYSALAAGDLTASIGDGVDSDDKAVSDTFPYLAAP